MASLVNPFNINGNYPIAGQDNDSQGFRDNFTNIKNNFVFIKQEVEDLQSKVVVKTALAGTTLDNNFLGSQLKNLQLKNLSETIYDWGQVGAATATEVQLDLSLGNIHKLQATGSIKINSIIKNFPSALQFARLLFYFSIDSVTRTLELPNTLTTDVTGIPGLRTVAGSKVITFTEPGNYIFEFSSVDSGSTVFVRELTKGNPVFRDPNFYMSGIGTYARPSLYVGWGNLIPIGSKIDATKSGADTLSIRGGVTSFMNQDDAGNDPTTMTSAGFSIAKSRTVDQGAGVTSPTEIPVNSSDYIGYFNALAYLPTLDQVGVKTYQQVGSIGFYANGANADGKFGGNIVISTKRDGGALTAAVIIDVNQNVTINGSLDVRGNTTVVESTVVNVKDVNIVVASGSPNAASANAGGISVDYVQANILYFTNSADATLNNRWNINKPVTISDTTGATLGTTNTGALVVGGGISMGGNLNIGGNLSLTASTEATSTTAAAFALSGGLSAVKNIIAGGNLFANSISTSSNLSSGAFQIQGGAAILGNLYVGGQTTSGLTQSGVYVLASSQSTTTSSGALVVKGGAGIAGNVYLSDASSANGVVITSTLNVSGTSLTDANATVRTATSALRVKGGSIFEGNIVIGVGSSSGNIGPGRVFIDNNQNAVLGLISTGGLVLGNGTATVGMSVSGDFNLGTTNTGALYILNQNFSLGTVIATQPTPYVPILSGTTPFYGALTAKGGANIFGNVYIGQPHDGTLYNSGTGVYTGTLNPATNRPIGAWSGNLYLQSGNQSTQFNNGALVVQQVRLADGSTSDGGMGIAGNVHVGQGLWIGEQLSAVGNLVVVNTTESTGASTGSIMTLGGVYITKRLNVAGNVVLSSSTPSRYDAGTPIGALLVTGTGGVYVAGAVTTGPSAGTIPSIVMNAGTLTSGANIGAVEFASPTTGVGLYYASPTTGSRGIIDTSHYYAISGNASLNAGATINSGATYYGAFGGSAGTAGALSVIATTTYEIDIKLTVAHAATPTASTFLFTFGGTATYAYYNYEVLFVNSNMGDGTVAPSAQGASGSLTEFASATGTMPSTTTGVVAASNTFMQKTIRVRGLVRTNTAGTMVPQVGWGTSPATIVNTVGLSYFKATPIGSTATVSVGSFSAT